jgi:hypothetical protein
MRTPVVLLLLALAGLLGGGALIGMWCLGVCLIFAALVAGAFGFLLYDWPERKPGVHVVPAAQSVADVLERARAA